MKRTFLNFRFAVVIGFAMVLISGSGALGESEYYEYHQRPQGPFHHPVPPFPVEMGFSQDHSSTYAEGVQRGRAAVIQAWGNRALAESQAAILGEQARWLNRENDLKQTEALHAQQKMWREAREEVRAHHEARVAAAQVKLAARQTAVYRQAYQLSPAELNIVTGEIGWPVALQSAKYGRMRQRVEELFRQQIAYGERQPGIAAEIARSTDELMRSLRSDIHVLPRAEYFAAQKFLRGLKYESIAKVEAA